MPKLLLERVRGLFVRSSSGSRKPTCLQASRGRVHGAAVLAPGEGGELVFKRANGPVVKGAEDAAVAAAFRGEVVLEAGRALVVELALDKAVHFGVLQPRRSGVGRDAFRSWSSA